jgi:hypothetical protein
VDTLLKKKSYLSEFLQEVSVNEGEKELLKDLFGEQE